jgi:Protein of unknown function (DUF1570)
MTNLPRTTGVIVLLLCVAVASAAEAQWRRLDSPNFVVIGDVSEGSLRDIAVKFEAFREFLGRVLGERAISTPVPTVVLVFPHERAFTPFKPVYLGKPKNVAGLFLSRRDINYIAIVNDERADRFGVVFHEFAHLVISNLGTRVPLWLNEGLAEYYSTFEIYKGGREAILGSPLRHHLARLNETPLLPLDQLLGVDDESPLYNEDNRRSLFYAQSWALTHMILHGDRTSEQGAYLDQLSKGVPTEQAWIEAFGTQNIARELEIYVRRQSFRHYQFKFSDKLATFEAAATMLPPADAEAFLADYLVQDDRLDEAVARLTAAKLDGDRTRIEIVAAQIDTAKSNFESSEKRLRALSPPADWLAAYRAGIAVAKLSEEKRGRADPQHVEAARLFFDAAGVGHPVFANTLARMAFLEVSSGGAPSAETRAAIERARELAPGRHEYAVIHAQVLARQSDFAAARSTLGPLLTSVYPEAIRAAARKLMSSIVEVENARASRGLRATPADAPAAVVLPPPIGNAKADEPPALARNGKPDDFTVVETREWLFRKVGLGEQRVEGTLDGIECTRQGRPVFNLKTANGIVRFVARELMAVDLISYRNDLSGGVECGPFKETMLVYVTWRPAGDASGAKIAIAIEFLPKKSPGPDSSSILLKSLVDSAPTTAARATASTRSASQFRQAAL